MRSGTIKGAPDGRSATGRQEEDDEEVDGEDEGDDGVVDAGAKVDKVQEKRKLAYVHSTSTHTAFMHLQRHVTDTGRSLILCRQHPDGSVQ